MNIKNILKAFGPGILFASTAIGVSHLVQSTRAGANYGFALVLFVIAANLFKYPFFEFSSRYANATGTSIVKGYKQLGKWALWIYTLITISSMFFVTAAVGAVTAGFMDNLLGISQIITIKNFPLIAVFTICIIILIAGRYKLLDSLIKIIASVLLLSTLLAFVLTLFHGRVEQVEGFTAPLLNTPASIAFIIALLGWMPTAMDLSSWNSIWTLERIKQTGYKPTMKETVLDFNFGYIASAILSIIFITLGAYLMYGSGSNLPNGSAAFANSVVQLYTKTIGNWSYFIIAASAFSIMFGTIIAVFDGYSRTIEQSVEFLFFEKEMINKRKLYIVSLLVIGAGSFIIVIRYGNSLKKLVDLATTISFLIAPLIAIANYTLVQPKYVGKENTPPAWKKYLAIAGIVFLIGFSLFFIWDQYIKSLF